MRSITRRLFLGLAVVLLSGGMVSRAFGQVPTATLTPTNTPCGACTFTSTPTSTPTNTPANTFTATATPTSTNTPANTFTPTSTPTLTATSSPTATPTTSPTNTPSNTSTPTATITSTLTATPSPTPTGTPSPTPSPTATSLFSPTPTPPFTAGNCSTIETYAYPDPVPGNSMRFLFVLCEAAKVNIRVYNPAVGLVASYSTNGFPGPNVYPVDASVFSHGVYYYFVQSSGPSGVLRSKPMKFAVVRSP